MALSRPLTALVWRTVPPDDLRALRSSTTSGALIPLLPFTRKGSRWRLEQRLLEAYTAAADSRPCPSAQQRPIPQNGYGWRAAQEAVLFVSSTKTDTIAFEEVVNDSFGDKPIFLAMVPDVELFEAVEGIENRFLQIEGTAPASEQTAVYQSFAASYLSQFGEEADQTPYTPGLRCGLAVDLGRPGPLPRGRSGSAINGLVRHAGCGW